MTNPDAMAQAAVFDLAERNARMIPVTIMTTRQTAMAAANQRRGSEDRDEIPSPFSPRPV